VYSASKTAPCCWPSAAACSAACPPAPDAAIFATAERVESLTDEFPSLSVAAYNGANTVLSGPAQDLEQAVDRLEDDGVRCDWLDTSHAFHSALLDPVLDEFEEYANRFKFAAPQRTLVCNRTGAALGRSAKLDGDYWRRHARQPVEFAKSVHTLSDLHCTMLLEVGPQPVLTAAAMRAWPDPATAHGRSRRCAETSPTTARSPKPSPTLTSPATSDFAALQGVLQQGPAHKLDLPPIRSSTASSGTADAGPATRAMRCVPNPCVFSRTAGSRNSLRCSTVRAAISRPLMC